MWELRRREQESRAVARTPRDAAAVLFGLKFTDNIQLRKPGFSSPNTYTGAKENLTQNGNSTSFKVRCTGVSEKAIRD